MDTTKFSAKAPKAISILKLIVVVPISVILLVSVVETTRLLFTWLKIESGVHFGVRYATAGGYDDIYCVDLDNDDTACNGNSADKETDIARIPSIKDEIRRNIQGLPYDETLKNTDNGYLKITICSNDTEKFIPPQARKPIYANCLPSESAGLPGQHVAVAIDYNFSFTILRFFGVEPYILHFASYREGIVEEFHATRAINTPVVTPSLLTPESSTPSPNGNPVALQLKQIDEILNQSLNASIAYNAPETMNIDEASVIELLLNPSIAESTLSSQITERGVVVTETIDIAEYMRAELFALDPSAFEIVALHIDDKQPISGTENTKWQWSVKPKKSGAQKLTLIIFRVIEYNGQEYSREVASYISDITVGVSFSQRIKSFNWEWIVGVILTAIIIPAFWRWIDKKKQHQQINFLPTKKKRQKQVIKK